MNRLFKHIMVIDPAVNVPELDCFNQLASLSKLPLSYHLPALFGFDSLKACEGAVAGIIIFGSGSSVNEGRPWQKEFAEWLLPRLEQNTPTLGLCYGHQMIAHVLGGKVDFIFSDRKKLRGFRNVYFEANPLWGGKPLEGELFVSHREVVMTSPPSMHVIGKSDEIAIDALAHPSLPIWTFQPHPEATPIFAKNQGVSEPPPVERFGFGHYLVKLFLDFVAQRTDP